ncbi:type II toxin-antitoxin system death-on-curing family toxin [Microbacterium stercoris]|uniref:Type II toxin-antitoxin system death-on-curing family toxin n=1 Tax=Microbacterium stercoris TaxID=2820289 RepID=A0A939TX44_9MICO|nr:type II toxin-antitoxin system death-on-curing family toxin [Microbacterium stercoris]MBO3663287.1 type II toxin-antitoxin system death-on-curing family toxin [Microbacterium stercoris]
MTRYLSLENALAVVDRMGLHVRDAGLLASALSRAESGFAGVDIYPERAEKAAALLESLARNHPLFDGNKRTAWTLTQVFLWLNDSVLDADEDNAFALILGVASGQTELEASASWLAERIRPRPS